eukprot:gene9597-biopygen6753
MRVICRDVSAELDRERRCRELLLGSEEDTAAEGPADGGAVSATAMAGLLRRFCNDMLALLGALWWPPERILAYPLPTSRYRFGWRGPLRYGVYYSTVPLPAAADSGASPRIFNLQGAVSFDPAARATTLV